MLCQRCKNQASHIDVEFNQPNYVWYCKICNLQCTENNDLYDDFLNMLDAYEMSPPSPPKRYINVIHNQNPFPVLIRFDNGKMKQLEAFDKLGLPHGYGPTPIKVYPGDAASKVDYDLYEN